MAAARLAAVLLIAFAAPLVAQNTSDCKLVIKVVDYGYGQAIRGARIGITPLPSSITRDNDWVHYALDAPTLISTQANAHGKATLRLAKGSYVVSVAANGFKHFFQWIEIRDEPTQLLVIKLQMPPTQ